MIIAIAALFLFLIFPDYVVSGCLNGLRLCANAVIPSLFPFFIVTRMLIASMPHSAGIKSALLVSFLGGYPVGASSITAMYENGNLEKKQAERALLFCNNSGPGFFVGMLGTYVFKNVKIGLLLYVVHITSALICAAIFQTGKRNCRIKKIKQKSAGFSKTFSDALIASCESMLQVCGLVVFFSAISCTASAIGIFRYVPPYIEALLRGLLELTGGVAGLSANSTGFVIAAFLMGWGGLCVHMQATCLWQKVGLRPRGYFGAKLLHGLISAFFALMISAKSLPLLLVGIILFSSFLLFPIFHKKWGRKKKKVVV